MILSIDSVWRAHSRARLGLLAFFFVISACGENKQEPAQAPVSNTPEQGNQIDKLRALGYADVSEEAHGDDESGVMFNDKKASSPGYNLYTNRFHCTVVLMDAEGNAVNRWQRTEDRSWSNSQLLPNGDLLVIGQKTSDSKDGVIDEHRYLLRLSWDGEEIWSTKLNAHHDVEITPDGRIAVLGFRRNYEAGPEPGIVMREDLVYLLSQDGELLESRSLYETLISNPSVLELAPVKPVERPGLVYQDLIHSNSVEFLKQPSAGQANPLFADGHVLVSTRHQDAVIIFDWQSGELLWSWGRGELHGPHDATVLDNGHILILDNGLGRGWSRVVEVDPIERKIVWEYKADPPDSFYTASRGSAQRLPNGNTLIAEADRARAFEVTPAGRIVWAWVTPERDSQGRLETIVRMKRLSTQFVDGLLAGK